MTDSYDRLRRRTLLAPLVLPLLVLMAGAGFYWFGDWSRTTVVVLIRHAEPQASTNGDPDLSVAGEHRIAALGEFLADLLVTRKADYLYAADTRRAQQTAAPVANQFGLPINLLASNDWTGLAGRIRREHRGETIVVVGYATTLPLLVEQLAGTKLHIPEDDFDSVYVLVMPSPGDTRVLRMRYGNGGTSVAAATAAAESPSR